MNATLLLDYLSGFESLITRTPEQMVDILQPYISMFSSAGRYLIVMLFVFYILQKVVKNQIDDFKKTLVYDVIVLCVMMVLFGTEQGYAFVTVTFMKMYNAFGCNLFNSEMFQFKADMRLLIDALAESGKHGVDLFNIKAMAANALAFVLSAAIYLLLLTYYIFVTIGMFYLMIALGSGPLMAGFFFFLKRPFYNWLNLVIASIIFPLFSAVALCVINSTSLIPGLEQSFIGGSMLVCLIQAVLAIGFMQLVIIFHATLFGVEFLNVPVHIISIVQALNGILHSPILNYAFILGNKKKG
jgi:hypothetical protein